MNLIKKILFYFKKKKKTESVQYFYTKDIFREKKYFIGEYTYGHPKILFENNDSNLIIGKFCSIADNVTIFLGGNHRTDWITTYPFNILNDDFPKAKKISGHPSSKGDVVIGNDVWIGRNVIILSGIKIGDGAVIAAGSVVTKHVGCYEIWGGNPARLLKKRFKDDEINNLLKLKWWDWKIEKINEEIYKLCSNNINYL